MITPEVRRAIEQEIRKHMNIILSGQAGANSVTTETIDNLYPEMPSMTDRPIMHPYGFVSRAPAKTISVTARQGENPGNRLILGHRDAARPQLESGESGIYNLNGYEVRLKGDSIVLGKNGTFETAVVGETLVTLLSNLITELSTHTHLGNMGAPTSPPQNSVAITNLKTQYLDNEAILAKDGGAF